MTWKPGSFEVAEIRPRRDLMAQIFASYHQPRMMMIIIKSIADIIIIIILIMTTTASIYRKGGCGQRNPPGIEAN